LPLLFNFM